MQAGSVLEQGHQGPLVRKVQELLGVEPDGLFGPMTAAAVMEYQTRTGLRPASGRVGPTTLERLSGGGFPAQAVSGAGPASSSTAAPETNAGGSRWTPGPDLAAVRGGAVLQRGHSGEGVAALQRLLGVSADGRFGDETASAVEAFQRAHRLNPVSGIVGQTILAALEAKGQVPADAARQMQALLAYAESHNSGASRGRCFEYVWRYLVAVGYGRIRNHSDASDMNSAYARNFAEYMNAGGAARWGLQRLSIATPYEAPPGAVIVVGPGTPGTAHPVAGDIAVAAGGGRFINDGPNMSYGPPSRFLADGGWLMGAYIPAR